MQPASDLARLGAWWSDRAVLSRYLRDLLNDELTRLRPGAAASHKTVLGDAAGDDDPLPVDSLELLSLASAVTEATHLHVSGIEDYLLMRRTFSQWLSTVGSGLEAYDQALSFRTSGSTGAAKTCTHAMSTLLQESEALARLFLQRQRVITLVPAHHIYGFLFSILLPRALGLPEERVLDLRASGPGALVAVASAGDLVIGHPAYWQAVVRAGIRFPAGVTGVSSTAPCDDATAAALQHAGLEQLVQIYGSSETAGVGWRKSHGLPFTLFPWWDIAGSEGEQLVRALPDGSTQRLSAPDHLRVEADGRSFLPAGRRDHAVQVGGTNVFPRQVEDVLRTHPAVGDVAVRLMRPEEGQRLKAFIVPANPGADVARLSAALNTWIDACLPVPQRPRALSFGDALPTTAAGKPCDWQI